LGQKVSEVRNRNDNEKRPNESHDQLRTLVLEVYFWVITQAITQKVTGGARGIHY
jgi:hypothetical protein